MASKSYLIDTCAALWYWAGSDRLSEEAKRIILDVDSDIRFHQVSFLEITIKYSLGKLILKEPPSVLIPKAISQSLFSYARLGNRDIARLESLHFHHRDPFDRILIAHALEADLTIISPDKHFADYPVKVVW